MTTPTYTKQTAQGDTNVFPVPFPYLSRPHVRVFLDDVELPTSTLVWPTDGTVQLPFAAADLAGKELVIRRVTPVDPPEVTFQPGPLDPEDLNRAVRQNLYSNAENRDLIVGGGGGGGGNGDLAQEAFSLANVANTNALSALSKVNALIAAGTSGLPEVVLGSLSTMVMDGVTDNTVAFRAHVAKAQQLGAVLVIPPQATVRLTETITTKGRMMVRGYCGQLYFSNAYPNDGGKAGSFILFDHPGKGWVHTPADGSSAGQFIFDGVRTRRKFVAPVSGQVWNPTNFPADIEIASCSVMMDRTGPQITSVFLVLREMHNQVHLGTIEGQCLQRMVQYLSGTDVFYAEKIHAWPYWNNTPEVNKYTLANCDLVEFFRADSPYIGSLFGIYCRRLTTFRRNDGTITGAPTAGITTHMRIGHYYADNCATGLEVFANCDGVLLSIGDAMVYGDPYLTTADHGMIVGSPGVRVRIGYLWSNNIRGRHFWVSTGGSWVDIDQFDEGSWNGFQPISGTASQFEGLRADGGSRINVGNCLKANATTAHHTSYGLTGSGAKRAGVGVRMVLERGYVNSFTGTNGATNGSRFRITTNPGQFPDAVRLSEPFTSALQIYNYAVLGAYPTYLEVDVRDYLGNPVASNTNYTVEYELVACGAA